MARKSAYGASAREIGELFADFLEGGSDRPVIALGTRVLEGDARNAIEKSLNAFGFSADSCTFAVVGALDAQAVFLLVEGLDPLHVIVTDREATAKVSQAYRTDYPVDAPIRVAGRQSVSFTDLHALMATPELKQRAWKLLKTLVG